MTSIRYVVLNGVHYYGGKPYKKGQTFVAEIKTEGHCLTRRLPDRLKVDDSYDHAATVNLEKAKVKADAKKKKDAEAKKVSDARNKAEADEQAKRDAKQAEDDEAKANLEAETKASK